MMPIHDEVILKAFDEYLQSRSLIKPKGLANKWRKLTYLKAIYELDEANLHAELQHHKLNAYKKC